MVILIAVAVVSITVTAVYAEQQISNRVIVISNTTTPIIEFRDQGSKAFFFQIPDGSKQLQIYDGSAGVARITVSNAGNVGIGTTTPTEKLHVQGNIKLTGSILSNGDICIGKCT